MWLKTNKKVLDQATFCTEKYKTWTSVSIYCIALCYTSQFGRVYEWIWQCWPLAGSINNLLCHFLKGTDLTTIWDTFDEQTIISQFFEHDCFQSKKQLLIISLILAIVCVWQQHCTPLLHILPKTQSYPLMFTTHIIKISLDKLAFWTMPQLVMFLVLAQWRQHVILASIQKANC